MKKEVDFKRGVRGKYADKKIKILGANKTVKNEQENEVSTPQNKQRLPNQD